MKVEVETVQPAVAPKPKIETVTDDEAPPPRAPRPAIEPRRDGLPNPPTDEPVAYAAWFAKLPRATQRKINSVCRAAPRSYQYLCGGIGHLHIPYPPFPRAHVRRASDPPIYWSYEAWDKNLSGAQKRYIERMCPGGEEQPSSDLCGDNTPLVVAFDDEPIRFTAGGSFAFAPGVPSATDWPAASTPWIVLDRDGNGAIDSGAELFGSNTRLPSGETATNGFIALAALDGNHDGVIDATDPAFASLQLWADHDGDQRSTRDELRPLGDSIVSISLAARMDARCDARDNCEGERASITWRDADGSLRTGSVVDVYLPRR